MNTDPKHYGLPSRVQLEALPGNRLGIRKIVKSRIIRKDAVKITETAKQIKETEPSLDVALICTRNICSKSLALLRDENIGIEYVDL